MTASIHSLSGVSSPVAAPGQSRGGAGGFAGALTQAADRRHLRFSAHATRRLASRDIRLDGRRLDQLAQATDRAAAKSARNSLVLLDELGLIVNVPSRTVVTALDPSRMRDGVFTDIDSTVIIRDDANRTT